MQKNPALGSPFFIDFCLLHVCIAEKASTQDISSLHCLCFDFFKKLSCEIFY